MYELNKRYGFYKFILLVPTTPIKEGTRSFIESDYAKQHFADLYPGRNISLSVLNAQKKTKGRKMFPQAISDFARGTRLEKNRINALLMSSGMLLSRQRWIMIMIRPYLEHLQSHMTLWHLLDQL